MSKITFGSIVRSEAGNDKGRYFAVVSFTEDYVFLCDGKRRKAQLPKKKKFKHVVCVGYVDSFLNAKLTSGGEVTNKEVKRAVSNYLKQIDNN